MSEIVNVNKFAYITTAVIEGDFKGDCLFRTCSIVANLLTSFELRSNLRSALFCCALSSHLKNSSVFNYSSSDSSAAASSGSIDKRTVPEQSGRKEEQSSIKDSKGCSVKPDVHSSMKP